MAIQTDRYNYININAAGTYNIPTTPVTSGINAGTTLQPGKCVLHSIIINSTSTGSVVVYDASGLVSGMPKVGTIAASSTGSFNYHSNITNGITLVLAQAGDITVTWSL